MGWFDRTLLGHMVIPFEKKVMNCLKEGYEYEVSPHLSGVFNAFCEQHHSKGFDAELTSVLFMVVAINSLEPDGNIETEKFVYLKNVATIGGLPHHTKQQNSFLHWREIRDIYIEASSKHLQSWIIEELWSEDNNNSFFLMVFDEIEEKNLEKLNDYFGF